MAYERQKVELGMKTSRQTRNVLYKREDGDVWMPKNYSTLQKESTPAVFIVSGEVVLDAHILAVVELPNIYGHGFPIVSPP